MTASTLLVGEPGTPRNVILANGAQARNVYWQVGSSATINAAGGGTMVDTIIASAGVTFSTAGQATITTLNGRALGLSGSVTMVNTVIDVPAPSREPLRMNQSRPERLPRECLTGSQDGSRESGGNNEISNEIDPRNRGYFLIMPKPFADDTAKPKANAQKDESVASVASSATAKVIENSGALSIPFSAEH
jgi:hypothetical protein